MKEQTVIRINMDELFDIFETHFGYSFEEIEIVQGEDDKDFLVYLYK